MIWIPSEPAPERTLTDSTNRIAGTALAWKFRNQSKGEFLAGNRTQTGQETFPPSHMAACELTSSLSHSHSHSSALFS